MRVDCKGKNGKISGRELLYVARGEGSVRGPRLLRWRCGVGVLGVAVVNSDGLKQNADSEMCKQQGRVFDLRI